MKSNEQFARKCLSNLPRLRGRNFRIVLVAKRTVRPMHIKSSSEEQLIAFFNLFQSFMIDNDLLATPTMGEEDDLFVTFAPFQFHVGNYAHAAPVDFLEAIVSEFYFHSLVGENAYANTVKSANIDLDEEITRRLQVPLLELRRGGVIPMQVRRYIPGPRGFNKSSKYHTTSWASWGRETAGETTLMDLEKEPHLVVVVKPWAAKNDPKHGRDDLRYALSIPEFLAYAERKNLSTGPVSWEGDFTISRIKD